MLLRFHDVSFEYEQAPAPILEAFSHGFAPGWHGIVGANGTGKTTLLFLACGLLSPDAGHVESSGTVAYCPQRTDDPPESFGELLGADDRDAHRLKGRLGLGDDWAARWETLSHGERKRAQIGAALWRGPDILAVDEPTNHLDAPARDRLISALEDFHGIGLIVSHDRRLLDSLCRMCVFMEPPRAVPRVGGYSAAQREAAREQGLLVKEREIAKRRLGKLERASSDRRRAAAGADKKRSKRRISPKDHDAKERINMARLTGRDGVAGRLASAMKGRVKQARARLDELRVYRVRSGSVWMAGAPSRRNTLFDLPQGAVRIAPGRTAEHPALRMEPTDRIGISGPNGGGKSTLVEHLVRNLHIPADRLVYLRQETTAEDAASILDRIRLLSRDELGQVLSIVDRLGSDPRRVLDTALPSPGELRKLLLALGIIGEPQLVIMDEPTNHLDLPSIEALEDALRSCPCGLLLVSHDPVFLDRLTEARWEVGGDGGVRII